jgi:nicotinamidase/pyrazinamidase
VFKTKYIADLPCTCFVKTSSFLRIIDDQRNIQMRALIAIDIQNDFCPDGNLAVAHGNAIIPRVNAMMDDFDAVILTQDWHPLGHSSFASSHADHAAFDVIDMPYGAQVLWPDHCLQGTHGAAFHPDLNTTRADVIIRKGMNPAIDSYSAFFENDHTTPTGLHGYLQTRGITDLTLVGLATDYCVNYSAIDAAGLGYRVRVELDACRAIDLNGSLSDALSGMKRAGVDVA